MSHQLFRNLGKLTKDIKLLCKHRNSCTFITPLHPGLPKNEFKNSRFQPTAAFCTSKVTFSSSDTSKTSDEVDVTNVSGKKKYWKTLGFDWYDQKADQADANYTMFWTVTIGIVLISFMFAYFPDIHHKNWSQREAYIEIARREALGLPHIEPNYIAPEKINLPTEEELGDFEIII